ncbi:extracellular solute-binding protein [Paenibacillus sp. MMS20-IR301]|uniref:ABC transporter substrate-binding protein n=1 Tax=Paenibacillus sp. MMS20-IR301 TaxID=2895946 RepID=UPI0028E98946|nr:extracellular solute-binding protein [Paenibacillus sp. MMS20-IR301]WNS43098.1 extracellular solute-binding protein [Paenibacillus sp. MMS20-IR301]
MKKASILLTLCFMLILTACGNNAGNSESGNNKPANQASGEGSSGEKVTIKLYTNAKGEPEEPMMKLVTAFNEQNDHIKVEHVALVQNNDSREMLQKLDVLSASGEEVDVVLLNNEGFVLERAGNGMLYPLDEFFTANNINPEDEYYRNPVYEGKHYAAMTDASFWFVALNENHLKDAGLAVPGFDWTWDDFREYSTKLAASGENRYGTYFHTFGEYANLIAYTDFKNPQMKEDGTLLFDDPSFEYWFNLRRAMEIEDKSVKPLADVLAAKQHWATDFMNGTTSMLPIAGYALDEAFLNSDSYPRDFKITFAPLPRSSASAETGLTSISGSFLTMHKNSKNKEAAFEFIKFATMEGAELSGRIPGWKKADGKAVLEKIIGDKSDLVDNQVLSNVLFDERVHTAGSSSVSVSYQQQLKKVAEGGINKFLLDNSTYDEAEKYMMDEGQKIIASNP